MSEKKVRLVCPECGNALKVPEILAQLTTICGECGATVVDNPNSINIIRGLSSLDPKGEQ